MLTLMTGILAEDRAKLYDRSLSVSSLERQAMHLAEECGEFQIAVSHLIRGRAVDKANFVEEAADVLVMIDEFCHYFDVTEDQLGDAVRAKMVKYQRNLDSESPSVS